MNLTVQPVTAETLEASWNVLTDAVAWTKSQGRRQRISNITIQNYMNWQSRAVNFAVWREGCIAGVFSLPTQSFQSWPSHDTGKPVVWLRALATHPDFRGIGIGRFAIQCALVRIGCGTNLYLDCVAGFLPGYYQEMGFEFLDEQRTDGFKIVLMRHSNNGQD